MRARRRVLRLASTLTILWYGVKYIQYYRSTGLRLAVEETSQKQSACTFGASSEPLPVHHNSSRIFFENHPNSLHRPQHQFSDCLSAHTPRKPALVVITVTRNPGVNFETTFANVQGQSLCDLRWILVDDYSDDEVALRRLHRAAREDSRIVLTHNTGQAGLAAGRNFGLDAMYSHPALQAPYVVMLDDDDLLELTTLEKAIWMLESNKQWSLASYHFIKFGHQNTTVKKGLHSGAENYYTVRKYEKSSVAAKG